MIHLSAKDICERLGVSKTTALGIIREAGGIKFGRTVRLAQCDFDKWRTAEHKADPFERTVVGPVVYFIQCNGPGGPVKIGRSEDVKRRLKTLRHANPYPLALLVAVTGGEALEADMHRRFSNDRLRGEWFAATPGLLRLVSKLREDS